MAERNYDAVIIGGCHNGLTCACYLAGAGLGALLSASGIGGVGVMVGLGFYLPFNIVLTYSLGTLARELADRFKGKEWSEEIGIPVAAGLIVGEALVSVGDALYIVWNG